MSGQVGRWNRLHLWAFLDLSCHVLTTPFRLDKAEVTGSSPVSPTLSFAGDSAGGVVSSSSAVRTNCAHFGSFRAAVEASAAGVRSRLGVLMLRRDGACLREGSPVGHGWPAEWARSETSWRTPRPPGPHPPALPRCDRRQPRAPPARSPARALASGCSGVRAAVSGTPAHRSRRTNTRGNACRSSGRRECDRAIARRTRRISLTRWSGRARSSVGGAVAGWPSAPLG